MKSTMVLKPRLSEKTYTISSSGIYAFDVPRTASKQAVAQAVSEQLNVSVVSVNILNKPGKAKRTIRKAAKAVMGKQSDIKKAYVTLEKGQTIPVFAAIEQEEAKSEKIEKAAEKAAKKAEKK